jgi:2-polyprenyl-6-methoxyphenol hydroxylase-like FAD-dependent oxidoreductase
MKTEVLVVGGGPVGLTMATELARYGVPVRIVDKAQRRMGQSRALMLWGRTLELLDRAGCAAALVDAGRQVTAASILAGGRTVGRIDLAAGDGVHPYAVILPQSETERLLEAHLNQLGVEVERSVEFNSFSMGADDVAANLRRSDGTTEKVHSSWLIGCDGAQSKVRDGLRKVFIGDAQPTRWVLGDVRLGGQRTPGEIDVGWHADGLLVILPIAGDQYRVMADLGPLQTTKGNADPAVSEVQALLDRRGRPGLTAFDAEWMASVHFNERKVQDYRAGRVFLAGEAAHVHSPAGAQGLNLGIQDAVNLAWKLALVWRRVCAEEPLLDSYSGECSAMCDRVLKEVPGRLPAPANQRGEAREAVRNHIAALLFGVAPSRITAAEVGYPDSPLNVPGPVFPSGPALGERAPIRAGEPPYGAGELPRFALCVDASDSTGRHGAAALMGIYKDLLEPEVRAPYAEGGLWLIRPDGYVAVSAERDERDRVAAYLDQIHRTRRLMHRAAALPNWLDSK